MKRPKKPVDEERALDLIERAVHLLRTTPFSTLMLFYVGALPFVLAVLFFLVDMSSSPFADDRCAGAALGAGLLYIWMRSWQALFCRRLAARLKETALEPLNVRAFFRQYRFQLIHASWGLVLLPLSALIAIPFGWVYAYFNNLCIVEPSPDAVRNARSLAMPWPRQNHVLIAIGFGFAYFVLFNWASVMMQLPGLLKSLGGIETRFAQSWHWMLDTTFWWVAVSLTYLVAEPLVKAVYVVRYHACESIQTGEDLLAELKSIPTRRRLAGAVRILIATLTIAFAMIGPAAANTNSAPVSSIRHEQLDASIDHVMKQREFTWRMPRERMESDEEKGFFGKFMDSIFQWMEDSIKAMLERIENFLEWLGDHLTPASRRTEKTPGLDPAFFKGLSVLLLAALTVVLVILLMRAWLARRKPLPEIEKAEVATIKVDLDDEGIIATMLEEDEWIKLAHELTASGELRKASRAWFLAGLACLARCDLLSIFHSKSNLDYQHELDRRARRCPDVIPVFGENIRLFERAWYGLHPALPEDVAVLEQNMERLRHGVEA